MKTPTEAKSTVARIVMTARSPKPVCLVPISRIPETMAEMTASTDGAESRQIRMGHCGQGLGWQRGSETERTLVSRPHSGQWTTPSATGRAASEYEQPGQSRAAEESPAARASVSEAIRVMEA